MTREAVTLEISRETARQLDTLAQRSGVSRSEALTALVRDAVTRQESHVGDDDTPTRARLAAPLAAQDAFLAEASVADEWRRF